MIFVFNNCPSFLMDNSVTFAIRVENLIRVAMNEPLRKTFKNIIFDEKYLK